MGHAGALQDRLERRVAPDGVVLVTPRSSWTRDALETLVQRATGWLDAQGLRRGDRLALQTHREPEAWALHLAALRRGVATLPLNPRYTRAERDLLLADAAPAHAVLVEPTAQVASTSADALAQAVRDTAPADAPDLATDDDLALLIYTSGTTGRPKGARILHRHLTACVTALHDAWAFTPADVLVHALPLFHIHGLVVAQHVTAWAGGRSVWLDGFDAAEVVEALHAHRATVFMGVPTFHRRLVDLPGDRGAPASMRLFTSGSAPLPADLHAAFEARYGHRILERYGMTEVGIVLSNPYEGVRKAGSVGLPLPGVSVRIVDRDDPARDLPDGEVGQVLIAGPSVFAGYLNRPEATAAALAGGWMHTGDLGLRDADGYIHLRGRDADLILVGGFNVYPAEVEAALRALPGVAEAAVVGLPDRDLGERVVGHVVAAPGADLDPEGLRAALREHLTAYKVPRAIVEVDDLPRNAMGKVQRHRLRARWTTPTLRPARRDELDRLAEGVRRMAAESEGAALDPEVVREGVARTFDADVPATVFVLTLGDATRGHPVGQLMVTIEWSDWRARPIGWAQSVWVDPAWRRRGVLRGAWSALEAWSRAEGHAALRLYVHPDNAAAIAAYEALGLEPAPHRIYAAPPTSGGERS